jgi:hypothetical protein
LPQEVYIVAWKSIKTFCLLWVKQCGKVGWILALNHPLLMENYPLGGIVVDLLQESGLEEDVPSSDLPNNVPAKYDPVYIEAVPIEVLVQVFPASRLLDRAYEMWREGAFQRGCLFSDIGIEVGSDHRRGRRLRKGSLLTLSHLG